MKLFPRLFLTCAAVASCHAQAPPQPAHAGDLAPRVEDGVAGDGRGAGGAPSAVTTTTDAKAPKLRLGHYSAPDGLYGLVLDRTGPLVKTRVDGTSVVLDLAVRRGAGDRTRLVSATGDLDLEVDKYGRVTRLDVDGRVPLLRDADAAALPDPPVPAVDAAALAALGVRARARCGATVDFAVDKSRAGDGSPALSRGLHHALERAVGALTAVCRDDAGRTAVARKLKHVRVVVVPAVDVASLRGDTLEVRASFTDEARGPFLDEMQTALERGL
ncbi:MAG: hypothetical protein KC657_23230 [Myxococcales bacterium]|nr:hypothetical protein [Myxococcales bacterium]